MTDAGDFPRRLRIAIGPDSANAFAKKSGIAESLFRRYLAGGTPGIDKAATIARTAGVNLEWLVNGQGPMRPGGELSVSDLSELTDVGDLVSVPLVAASASAGPGLVHTGEMDGEMQFSARWLRHLGLQPRATAILPVSGDSMVRPDGSGIPDGALALVNTAVTADDVITGCVYVLVRDEDLLIKRLERHMDGTITLHSDNPRYRSEHVPPDLMGRVHIAGRLLWNFVPVR